MDTTTSSSAGHVHTVRGDQPRQFEIVTVRLTPEQARGEGVCEGVAEEIGTEDGEGLASSTP
jgi:hypothetical protein